MIRPLIVLTVAVSVVACGAHEGRQLEHVRAETGPPPDPVRPTAAPLQDPIPVLHFLGALNHFFQQIVAADRERQALSPARLPGSSRPAPVGARGGFLACVVRRESGGNPTAVNPSSGAGGLFQDLPSTWRNAANEVDPNISRRWPRAELAPVSVQWQVNEHLYATQGRQPWAGGRYRC